MVHLLPQMNLLLLRPRRPRIACLVHFARELSDTGLHIDSGTCCDLILANDRRHPDSVSVLMMVVWENTTVRCFINFWLKYKRISFGSHAVRIIQRAWRRCCERRRLAVCVGWREEGSLLARVLRTLCVEDLRRMTL